jgi:hypothetical protein
MQPHSTSAWCIAATALLCSCLLTEVARAAPEPTDADQLLSLIKMALLDATLDQEVSIATAGFIDGSGKLIESTVFGSSIKVEGVRVLSYLEAEPEIPEIDRESLPPALWPLTGHGCASLPNPQITRNIAIGLRIDAPAVPEIFQDVPRLLNQVSEVIDASLWSPVRGQTAPVGAVYQQLLLASSNFVATDYQLAIDIRQVESRNLPGWRDDAREMLQRVSSAAKKIVSSNPLIEVRPSADGDPLVLSITFRLSGPESPDPLTHQRQLELFPNHGVLVREFPIETLYRALTAGTDEIIHVADSWGGPCRMVLHRLHPEPGTQGFALRLGSANGLSVGHRFLLLSEAFRSSGLLAANAADSIAIGEVTLVGNHESFVTIVSGDDAIADAPGWALAF